MPDSPTKNHCSHWYLGGMEGVRGVFGGWTKPDTLLAVGAARLYPPAGDREMLAVQPRDAPIEEATIGGC